MVSDGGRVWLRGELVIVRECSLCGEWWWRVRDGVVNDSRRGDGRSKRDWEGSESRYNG